MPKHSNVARTEPEKKADLLKDVLRLASALTNERVYTGVPETDKRRLFDVAMLLSEQIGRLKADPEGNSGRVFSAFCGLQEIEREVGGISRFFVGAYAMVEELKGNGIVAGNDRLMRKVGKAEKRINGMMDSKYDEVTAELVEKDLDEVANAARIAGSARKD